MLNYFHIDLPLPRLDVRICNPYLRHQKYHMRIEIFYILPLVYSTPWQAELQKPAIARSILGIRQYSVIELYSLLLSGKGGRSRGNAIVPSQDFEAVNKPGTHTKGFLLADSSLVI